VPFLSHSPPLPGLCVAVALLDLRRMDRACAERGGGRQGATEGAKAPVEGTTLQLHNLQYEMNHYAKAIAAARDFRTKYPGISLVPLDQFLREAPAHLAGRGAQASAGAGGGGEGRGHDPAALLLSSCSASSWPSSGRSWRCGAHAPGEHQQPQ